MFTSARLKLTGWYLLIIMLVGIAFSVVIYTSVVSEMERGFKRAELRLEAEEMGIELPERSLLVDKGFDKGSEKMPPRYFLIEDIDAAKQGVLIRLITANGIILVVSAIAGYFLAENTTAYCSDYGGAKKVCGRCFT